MCSALADVGARALLLHRPFLVCGAIAVYVQTWVMCRAIADMLGHTLINGRLVLGWVHGIYMLLYGHLPLMTCPPQLWFGNVRCRVRIPTHIVIHNVLLLQKGPPALPQFFYCGIGVYQHNLLFNKICQSFISYFYLH